MLSLNLRPNTPPPQNTFSPSSTSLFSESPRSPRISDDFFAAGDTMLVDEPGNTEIPLAGVRSAFAHILGTSPNLLRDLYAASQNKATNPLFFQNINGIYKATQESYRLLTIHAILGCWGSLPLFMDFNPHEVLSYLELHGYRDMAVHFNVQDFEQPSVCIDSCTIKFRNPDYTYTLPPAKILPLFPKSSTIPIPLALKLKIQCFLNAFNHILTELNQEFYSTIDMSPEDREANDVCYSELCILKGYLLNLDCISFLNYDGHYKRGLPMRFRYFVERSKISLQDSLQTNQEVEEISFFPQERLFYITEESHPRQRRTRANEPFLWETVLLKGDYPRFVTGMRSNVKKNILLSEDPAHILRLAALGGSVSIMDCILNHLNIDPHTSLDEDGDILCLATSKGHVELVAYLMKIMGVTNSNLYMLKYNGTNYNLLAAAAGSGSTDLIRFFIDKLNMLGEDSWVSHYCRAPADDISKHAFIWHIVEQAIKSKKPFILGSILQGLERLYSQDRERHLKIQMLNEVTIEHAFIFWDANLLGTLFPAHLGPRLMQTTIQDSVLNKLHAAARFGNLETLQAGIAMGMDPYVLDPTTGCTLLQTAELNNQLHIVSFLREYLEYSTQ